MPSPAARAASRSQGSAFAATAARVLAFRSGAAERPDRSRSGTPDLSEPPDRSRSRPVHLSVAIGVAAAAAGLGAREAAAVAAYHAVSGPASAGLRLLGLDPVEVTACLARLAQTCDALAAEAKAETETGRGATEGVVTGRRGIPEDVAALPAPAAPLLDALQERHAARRERLFAS
jgi:urease accessory protein